MKLTFLQCRKYPCKPTVVVMLSLYFEYKYFNLIYLIFMHYNSGPNPVQMQ